MGFRFRKSFKAGPFRLNLSKKGIGWSVGGKGYRYTKKAGGGSRHTWSIPGTGVSYTKDTGGQRKSSTRKSTATTRTTKSSAGTQSIKNNSAQSIPTYSQPTKKNTIGMNTNYVQSTNNYPQSNIDPNQPRPVYNYAQPSNNSNQKDQGFEQIFFTDNNSNLTSEKLFLMAVFCGIISLHRLYANKLSFLLGWILAIIGIWNPWFMWANIIWTLFDAVLIFIGKYDKKMNPVNVQNLKDSFLKKAKLESMFAFFGLSVLFLVFCNWINNDVSNQSKVESHNISTSSSYNIVSSNHISSNNVTSKTQSLVFGSFFEEQHPVFCGSVETAKAWGEAYGDKVNVCEKYADENVIYIENGYKEQESVITDIQLYLSRAGIKELDQTLEIVKAWLPFDKMNTYYQKADAFVLYDKDTQNIPSHYFYVWQLNDVASEQRKSNKLTDVTYKIVVRIDREDDGSYFARINDDVPNWTWSSNSYTKSEWNYKWGLASDTEITTSTESTVATTTTKKSTTTSSNKRTIILNTDTKCYHLSSTCRAAKKIKVANKKIIKSTIANVKSQGYSACGICAK